MTQGLDFSYARPTPAEIVEHGYTFVMRYLSWEPGKNITPSELAGYLAVGLKVGFVWEAQATDPELGSPQGAIDGAEAGRQLAALGVPTNIPVFWALDTDDRGDNGWQQQLLAYDQAFDAACAHPGYPYGSNRVIDFFGGGWQTQAWSDGVVSSHAWLLQYAGAGPIANTDVNELYNSYALYPALTSNPTPRNPADWLDTVDETTLRTIVNSEVTKVLNTGTAKGQPSWAHTVQATLGQEQANAVTLRSIVAMLVAINKTVSNEFAAISEFLTKLPAALTGLVKK